MPEEVRSQLRLIPVETMDEVLAEALIDAPRPAAVIKAERAARQKQVTKRPARTARRSRREPEVPVPTTPELPVEQPPAGSI